MNMKIKYGLCVAFKLVYLLAQFMASFERETHEGSMLINLG